MISKKQQLAIRRQDVQRYEEAADRYRARGSNWKKQEKDMRHRSIDARRDVKRLSQELSQPTGEKWPHDHSEKHRQAAMKYYRSRTASHQNTTPQG